MLKDKNILGRKRYKHFLKYSVAMRILLFPNNSDELLLLCSKGLDSFCRESIALYGKEFLSYNVHNVVYLVNDYKIYGYKIYVGE